MTRTLIQYSISAILLFTFFSCAKKIQPLATKPEKTIPTPPEKEARTRPSSPRPVKRTLPSSKILTTYQSTGNDMASIALHIRENKTFDFQMTILPKTVAEKEERIILTGTWKRENDKTLLHCDKKEVDLNTLFDKNLASGEEFEIVAPQKVAIYSVAKVIHIWGVACEKK